MFGIDLSTIDAESIMKMLGIIVVFAPTLLMVVLGLASLLSQPFGERAISRSVQISVVTGLLASLALLGMMLVGNKRHVPIELGEWVHIPHFHFEVKFLFDRLSVPFAILTYILCGTIGIFCNRYMHREHGFNRFFVLYALFMLGMIVTSLAGTIETLFTGWEMVGLSSALLVAFYHERPSPVRNGLRVWVVYRISDAALLIASVFIHQLAGSGDFEKILGISKDQPWPQGQAVWILNPGIDDFHQPAPPPPADSKDNKNDSAPKQALIIGLLLLLAASVKSALVPFSGWLPRAMEGPTPSSAIFYGALSVHLGAFLLLRFSPILNLSPPLCAIIVVIGLLSAAFSAFAGRVQTDIKCALSFASITQVGLIVAEVGLGLRYIALIHIIGHACLRTLQFLRAPTLLHDYKLVENAIGDQAPNNSGFWVRVLPEGFRIWLYRLALERGYLDACLAGFFVIPFLRLLRLCDAMERRWTDFLSGGQSRESDQVDPSGSLEELL